MHIKLLNQDKGKLWQRIGGGVITDPFIAEIKNMHTEEMHIHSLLLPPNKLMEPYPNLTSEHSYSLQFKHSLRLMNDVDNLLHLYFEIP